MMDQETFRNKIFRSATFEGMADKSGVPTAEYHNLYRDLARQGVKNIITGCTFVSKQGKMVQPGQAGIDSDDLIVHYQRLTDAAHQYDSKIYLQISHAGRQSSSSVTGEEVVGASAKKSGYFRSKPKQLSKAEIDQVIDTYSEAALRALKAGFDGIQIHAAHGYLVHQFLHPGINDRTDEYGINPQTGIGDLFLGRIISGIRAKCGDSYPILVKLSAADDLPKSFSPGNFTQLIKMLDKEKVFAIEISFGTMENALNIFRGESVPFDTILNHNFRYKQDISAIRFFWKLLLLPVLKTRLIRFSEGYNLQSAAYAKSLTDIPIICVGGFRSGNQIIKALESGKTDYISLCRPFICEPDLLDKFRTDSSYKSKCVNCNMCAIMCDSGQPTRCYKNPNYKRGGSDGSA